MKKILFILIPLIFLTSCNSCQFSPDREDFESELSFMLADCNYRNNQNPIACVELAKRYNERDKNKEARDILQFCKDKNNYPDGWDNEKCRMFLKER